MHRTVAVVLALVTAGAVPVSLAAQRTAPPAEVVAIVAKFLEGEKGAGWESLDALPGLTWTPLPPKDLTNCLPDGGCYARQGGGTLAGRRWTAMATGARTILNAVYLRNNAAPLGESAILEALAAAGVTPELARCPAKGSAGGTNWYRLKAESRAPAILAVQSSCNGRACEGLTLTYGDELPPLQPAQVALYSNQCAAGASREPTSTKRPHEALADAVVALLPATGSAAGHPWAALTGLAEIQWNGDAPKPGNLSHLNDKNPLMLTGQVSYADRKFSTIASGSASHAKVIHLEEGGLHPKGEHMLGVVYQRGFAVQLVRCGPIYTESTNNWYRITSSRTQTAMIRQSICYDGNNVSDAYELRLDGSLPPRDPRDRDPGPLDLLDLGRDSPRVSRSTWMGMVPRSRGSSRELSHLKEPGPLRPLIGWIGRFAD